MERKEYVGEDGLLRCSVCNKPVEKILPFPLLDGTKRTVDKKVRVMCYCEMSEIAKEKEEQRKRRQLHMVATLKRVSLMDEKLYNARLSTFTKTEENEKLYRIASNYVENFDKMRADSQGLLMYGPVGTGKSYAAAVIANELMEKGISVVMTSFIKLLQMNRSFEDDADKHDSIMKAELLIIDDLGAERGTDYAMEKVYDIIDSRYRSNKPIILTTNLTMKEMKNCEDIRAVRIYDRIFEMCYPVKVEGMSWRKREAAERYYKNKEILEA